MTERENGVEMIEPVTSVVQTHRGPVEYSMAGTGEPILYFHGTGVTGDTMLSVERPLVQDGFRLIVPNRPGYGNTPLEPHRSATDCAEVVAALLDSLQLNKVAVMGSSGGAAFALSFALTQPDRTRSLTLLCPQLHPWDHPRWLPRTSRWTLPFLRRGLLRKLVLMTYRMMLRRMTALQLLQSESGKRYSEAIHDVPAKELCETTLAAMAAGTKYAGFENDLVVFSSEDIVGERTLKDIPVLVLHDSEDPMAPVEHVEWFAGHFPQCERHSIHAAGHLIWVGPDKDLMHQIRIRFLREH